jgi:ABC-2 type transport system ATP-binding protein
MLLLVVGLAAPALAASFTVREGFEASFDGTPIAWTLILPEGASSAEPVPVIFMTHGWAGSRTRDASSGLARAIVEAGYALFTWDQRGFGVSGGEANVDSQEFEVRDVRALIDLVARQPEIELDAAGDPRMGMVGGSYAGGIQLMTAAADSRVDAIVPQIAWNDLPQSIKPGGVIKLGWDLLLYGSGVAAGTAQGLVSPAGPFAGSVAPQIHQALVEGAVLNDWTSATVEWFLQKSPKLYVNGARLPGGEVLPGIRVPTFIVQGTIDNLFPLNEGIRNFEQVRANGAPVKLLFFCGGHVINLAGSSCAPAPDDPSTPQDESQSATIERRILAWFDRWVRGNSGVDTGSTIEYFLQDGTRATADALPTAVVSASAEGVRLVNSVTPTSGTVLAPGPSPDGVRVPIPVASGAVLLGVPQATVSVSGTGAELYLFFELLDVAPDGTVRTVDDQVMAKKVTWLSSVPQVVEVDLGGVAWRMDPGHELFLQIATTSSDHASSRFPASATVDVEVRVPVVS